ncbi:zinc-dependent alcohol dehydrogenase [Microbacterium sp. ASV49]|uniref:Zinc-binding alcohol dehydrogenase n=1 Tax=Microbacterium candidum TaxID=3041922 RepID=A0ABT7MVB3_9MICO|nr:zinc-binding alcohol dehydrogenase [Microbacterium sp. ASV49]MDL9978400.1 zinc-binding alcohol dehydrogenase [Microbacterium sp. ASV49]
MALRVEDRDAVALWTTAPGVGALQAEELPEPQPGEALVETLWTGVSRGTETIVARGEVPDGEKDRMRAPFQAGDFPFPVKYGYLAVGESAGRMVFALHPHQSRFVVPETALVPVPAGVPARRAVLAGAVETAVNVLWDARPLVGDRIAIVGAGMIGGAIAAVARRIPGVSVTLVDVDDGKRAVADALGVRFGDSADPDIVIEASGQAAGLQQALRLAPDDGEVVVASWYGSRAVPVELGGDFHSRRLTIRSSQVGVVAVARRARTTTRERLTLALRLLEDTDFDALLGGTTPWMQAPDVVAALAAGTADDLCHTIDWSDPT